MIKIKGIYLTIGAHAWSKINSPGDRQPLQYVVTFSGPYVAVRYRSPCSLLSLSLSFLRREAIILNSVPWPLFHPMGGPMQGPTTLVRCKKKKKAATQGPERGTRRRRCRSIYIIINRKEIYLIPRPKDSLFPLRLI